MDLIEDLYPPLFHLPDGNYTPGNSGDREFRGQYTYLGKNFPFPH